ERSGGFPRSAARDDERADEPRGRRERAGAGAGELAARARQVPREDARRATRIEREPTPHEIGRSRLLGDGEEERERVVPEEDRPGGGARVRVERVEERAERAGRERDVRIRERQDVPVRGRDSARQPAGEAEA